MTKSILNSPVVNLGLYFECNNIITVEENHSIQLFKEKIELEKIELHEKNLRLLKRLIKTTDYDLIHNEEIYRTFKNKSNMILLNPKDKKAQQMILDELNKAKDNDSQKILIEALKLDLLNYSKLIRSKLKKVYMYSRYCTNCNASYHTFQKNSRHCFNCKVKTSVIKKFDLELKKELFRFYDFLNQKNYYEKKLEEIQDYVSKQ